jgi:hypothetical protein
MIGMHKMPSMEAAPGQNNACVLIAPTSLFIWYNFACPLMDTLVLDLTCGL